VPETATTFPTYSTADPVSRFCMWWSEGRSAPRVHLVLHRVLLTIVATIACRPLPVMVNGG
jgi:hypothetical protein